LRATGYLPVAVTNHLARLGHHYEHAAFMSLDELAGHFDVAKLGSAPARHDNAQLEYWQREALARAAPDTLWAWMGEAVNSLVPESARAAYIDAVRPNILFPGDALKWARILFHAELHLSVDARESLRRTGPAFFETALQGLAVHGTDFKALCDFVKEHTGNKGKDLFHPLRLALTGELHGPEMGRVLPLLSQARAEQRFRACL
jgi:nondiscriminating glutamyl-tRNA synthetase